jgi:putative membrane protein
MHMWHGGWWMFLWPLMFIVCIAVILLVAVLILRWLGVSGPSPTQHAPPGRAPLDILEERFARGEIDKEEFEERRRALGK